jgi:hypothetical protein
MWNNPDPLRTSGPAVPGVGAPLVSAEDLRIAVKTKQRLLHLVAID